MLDRALSQKNDGEFRAAVKTLIETTRAFPSDSFSHWLLGAILLSELKQTKKAIPHFQTATRLAPLSEKASLGLFHSLWGTDQRLEALEEMKRFQTVSHSKDYDEILAEIAEKSETE